MLEINDVVLYCISEEQFGFVKGRSTTDVIFALRQLQQLQERYREGQQDLHWVFVDPEKPTRYREGQQDLHWVFIDPEKPEF